VSKLVLLCGYSGPVTSFFGQKRMSDIIWPNMQENYCNKNEFCAFLKKVLSSLLSGVHFLHMLNLTVALVKKN
jgi:hypothetical protein